MQPTVYFLNRMSALQHMKRHRAGLRCRVRADRPGTGSTGRLMNKSHSPWTFFWRYPGSDTEPFHPIARECPRDLEHSHTCKWIYCICMCTVVYVSRYITTLWITEQASSFILWRPPQRPLGISKSFSVVVEFFKSSKACAVTRCQVSLRSSSNND